MNYIIILHVEMIMSKIHLQLDQIKSAPTVLDLSVIEDTDRQKLGVIQLIRGSG